MRAWREVRNFASQKFRLTPDYDPTGFCNSEPETDRKDFEKTLPDQIWISKLPLITVVKWLIRVFSDINRIGSNIWTGLPD